MRCMGPTRVQQVAGKSEFACDLDTKVGAIVVCRVWRTAAIFTTKTEDGGRQAIVEPVARLALSRPGQAGRNDPPKRAPVDSGAQYARRIGH